MSYESDPGGGYQPVGGYEPPGGSQAEDMQRQQEADAARARQEQFDADMQAATEVGTAPGSASAPRQQPKARGRQPPKPGMTRSETASGRRSGDFNASLATIAAILSWLGISTLMAGSHAWIITTALALLIGALVGKFYKEIMAMAVVVGGVWLLAQLAQDADNEPGSDPVVQPLPDIPSAVPTAQGPKQHPLPANAAKPLRPKQASTADTTQAPTYTISIGNRYAQRGNTMIITIAECTQVFRKIPAGTFTMGSGQEEHARFIAQGVKPECFANERRQAVTINQSFWLADSECTQAFWQAVMGKPPAIKPYQAEHPVAWVDWSDIQLFLRTCNEKLKNMSLLARLPTEAEWEYACRAGSSGAFAGDDLAPHAWYYDTTSARAAGHRWSMPVKRKQPNAWKLYDMHGNVSEWCAGRFSAPFAAVALTDEDLNEHEQRYGFDSVMRGGCFIDPSHHCRSAARVAKHSQLKATNVGFRLVVVEKP